MRRTQEVSHSRTSKRTGTEKRRCSYIRDKRIYREEKKVDSEQSPRCGKPLPPKSSEGDKERHPEVEWLGILEDGGR